MSEDYQFIHVYVPKGMYHMLRATAFLYEMSMSEVVRRAVLYTWMCFPEGDGAIHMPGLEEAISQYMSEDEGG